MSITDASLVSRRRILSVCVKLFLEQGYRKTTVADIVQQAKVSNSIFQNNFRAKDGVLTELVRFMFDTQFNMARSAANAQLPPAFVYGVETAIQLTLTELNENLREIYLEAYTHEEALAIIQEATARELYEIFGPYQPELTREDFYVLDLGTSGMMRGYMAKPCDENFSIEKKVRCFLEAALRVYRVPEEVVQQVVAFVAGLDIRAISHRVMEQVFKALAMHYDFTLTEPLLQAE